MIADIDGNTVDSDGNKTNIKEREYFQKAINGETVISEIMDSRIIPDKEIQVIAVPIESENVVTGILFGILDTGTLKPGDRGFVSEPYLYTDCRFRRKLYYEI